MLPVRKYLEQNKTKQNKIKQNKTKQNKTKQNKTKQNKTKQNKTKQKQVKVDADKTYYLKDANGQLIEGSTATTENGHIFTFFRY
jgi:chemotaxis protein histidine kinase CheA